MPYSSVPVTVIVTLTAGVAVAQDWSTVPMIEHAAYQAVNANGTSAYDNSFPVRLRGVVLNNSEDWLDPTPAYSVQTQWPPPPKMGGEAEIYVQAIDLDGSAWDPHPGAAFDDFGGTAAWIGQNYGNLPFKSDPIFSYSDSEWTAELGRMNLLGGAGVSDPTRAGDLVEIRARGGLHYKGKMNVNEQHSKEAANDFEIVLLQQGYGLPAATPLTLADIKDASDAFIFDPTRTTGGERYQSTLVDLRNVWIESPADFSANSDITVTDGTRTFHVHLGLNPSFDGTPLFDADEPFHVTGIFDQSATDGTFSADGYQLLVMHADDFRAVPEPATALCVLTGLVLVARHRNTRR